MPVKMRNRLLPRLQHWRRVLQVRFPNLRYALLPMVLLDYHHYRTEVELDQRIANRLEPKTWVLPQLVSIRWLLDLSRKPRNGKI